MPDPSATDTGAVFDVARIRADFPILRREVNGKPLVYLDNAATSQKPEAVLNAITDFYRTSNANIHRGVHTLSVEATKAYEDARAATARFLGAERAEEIVFLRGATEAINLVAQTYGRAHVGAGDEVIVTTMEHHSNIVPWQMLCAQQGATLNVLPIDDRGVLEVDRLASLITDRTRLLSITHVSNALGTINPVGQIVELAHERGVTVMVDGAQAAPHLPIDVRALGCDFYAITGHKMFGPTGIGALYARHELLDAMPPYQGGGEMIRRVTFEETTYNDVPHRFEAGTPDIAGAIGLHAAIDYMQSIGRDRIVAHEHHLLEVATSRLLDIPGLHLMGTAPDKASILSFTIDDVHAYDLGSILDQMGIAVRTGHHCAEPVMDRFGVDGTVRASLAMYNDHADIDALVAGIDKACAMLRQDPPMASTQLTIDELIERFEFLTEWEDRFTYLIELGKKLAPMNDADQTDDNLVHGCQATVYLKPEVSADSPPRLSFAAVSNAHIVNGLIAILQTLYNGRIAAEILALDAEAVVSRLGFDDHLSPTRKNGLHAMIKRIRELAALHSESTP